MQGPPGPVPQGPPIRGPPPGKNYLYLQINF
mgnify:CR=1 FL=1